MTNKLFQRERERERERGRDREREREGETERERRERVHLGSIENHLGCFQCMKEKNNKIKGVKKTDFIGFLGLLKLVRSEPIFSAVPNI